MNKTLFITFACVALNLQAAVNYVATTGNDTTGDGSIGNPWLTVQKFLNVCAAGDTLNVAAGTYAGTWNMVTAGSAGNTIKIIGPAGTNAIMTGAVTADQPFYELSYMTWNGPRIDADGPVAHNWTLHHNCVSNNAANWVYQQRSGATTNGPQNWVIVYNWFTDWNSDGVLTLMGRNHLVQSNLFSDGIRSWDCMRIWGDNHTISDNVFRNLYAGGLATPPNGNHPDIIQFFDGATNPYEYMSRSNVFERNYLTNSSFQFGNFEADNGSTNLGPWTYRNNVLVNSRSQLNNGTPMLYVYHNTIFGDTNVYGFRYIAGSDTTRTINNIFMRSATYPYLSNAVADFWADYNVITAQDDGGKYYVQEGPNGLTNALDPATVFVNYSAGDFRIKAGAIVIAAGTNLQSVVATDFAGNSRSTTPTIGAFEFVQTSFTRSIRTGKQTSSGKVVWR